MRFLSLILFIAFLSINVFGQTFTELGRFGGKGTKPGQFNTPLAVDISKDGKVYVVDTGNHRIQIFDLKGNFIKSVGGFGFNDEQFDEPRDIWTRSLVNIYVADYNNRRVQRFDRQMNFISTFSSSDGFERKFQFYEVASCAVTSQNDLFLVDHDENKILKFKRDDQPEREFGRFDSGDGELQQPEQIDMIGSDKIIVADAAGKLVIFDLFGNYITRIEHKDFKTPRGLHVDYDKNIYVADPLAGKIFYLSKDLKNVSPINFPTGLKKPQDIALTRINEQILFYVVDGDEIISGSLSQ